MRVQTVSDIHIDHRANHEWLKNISLQDYTNDILVIPGDISHRIELLQKGLEQLLRRFKEVVFVPGNHDLWVSNKDDLSTDKFTAVIKYARELGVKVSTLEYPDFRIVPLMSWYDFSFGKPCKELKKLWLDFQVCRWPQLVGPIEVTRLMLEKNDLSIPADHKITISCSHFVPRIDCMPPRIPRRHRMIYPVLGADGIDKQVRTIGSSIHVYGHSHVNRDIEIDGVRYVNNAFANPDESRIARKDLICIYED